MRGFIGCHKQKGQPAFADRPEIVRLASYLLPEKKIVKPAKNSVLLFVTPATLS